MKIVNYSRGYNSIFDCSIHGTIKMTKPEYKKAVAYIVKNKKQLDLNGGYPMFKTFCDDTQRIIWSYNGFYINVRDTATKMLVKHYKLDNYKRGNYQLFVNC